MTNLAMRIVNKYFRGGAAGQVEFWPHGRCGSGYLVTSSQEALTLRQFMWRGTLGLALWLGAFVLIRPLFRFVGVGTTAKLFYSISSALVLFVGAAYWEAGLKRRTAQLPRIPAPPTAGLFSIDSTQATRWLRLACVCLAFLGVGILLFTW